MRGLLSLLLSPILTNYIQKGCQLDSFATAKISRAISLLTDEISRTYDAGMNRALIYQKVDYTYLWLDLQYVNPQIDKRREHVDIEFQKYTKGKCLDVSNFFVGNQYIAALLRILVHDSKEHIKHMLINTPLTCICRSRRMNLERTYLKKRVQQREVQYLVMMMTLHRRFLERHSPFTYMFDMHIGATVGSLRVLFSIVHDTPGMEGSQYKGSKESSVPEFISSHIKKEDYIEIYGRPVLDIQSTASYTVFAWNKLEAATGSPQERRMIFNETFSLDGNVSLLRAFVSVLKLKWTREVKDYKQLYSVVCIYDFIHDYAVLSGQACDISDIQSALVELILNKSLIWDPSVLSKQC